MSCSKYISKLEDDGNVFSTFSLSLPIEFDEFISKRKVVVVCNHSTMKEGKRIYEEKLFKTTQGFYIYLIRESESMIGLTIYYKQEQSNEFDLFIGQLLKQFNKKD